MEQVRSVVQNNGTREMLKTGLNRSLIQRKNLEKLDECEGSMRAMMK